MCAYCACAVHSLLMMAAFKVLSESLWIWWLTIARRNSYQPVLVRIFRNCAIVEAWLPFMTCRECIHDVQNMYPQNITVRLKFSVHDICKLWSHCSHYKHDLHDYRELFDEYSAPFSPEVIRSLIMTPTSILNDITLSIETERSAIACCWGE